MTEKPPAPAPDGTVATVANDSEAPDVSGSDAEARVIELEDHVRRSQADYENLRKRFDREVARERAAEGARVASAWLPVLDDLERALDHTSTSTSANPQAILAGLTSIRDQAVAVLSGLGYHRFDVVGEPFDPTRHEAIGTVDAPGPAGSVAVLVRAGYGSDHEVLRPASVLVCSGSV